MHDAICDECGRNCQVPFRPSGDKPIYCSDCFEKKGGRESNRPSWRDSGNRNFDDRDRGRPSQGNISDPNTSRLVEKIEILNTKLETIIKLLSSAGEKKSAKAKGKKEKNKKSKPKKRTKTKVYSSVKNKASAST